MISYRRFDANEWLDQSLTLDGRNFSIVKTHYNGLGWIAHAAQGKKATVYKIRNGRRDYALKVFRQKHAIESNIHSTKELNKLVNVRGLLVCDRIVVGAEDSAANGEPGLLHAIVMPWINGNPWSEIVSNRMALTGVSCMALARHTAEVFGELESMEVAHTDVCSRNTIVALKTYPSTSKQLSSNSGAQLISTQTNVQLIDIEDMFGNSFRRPVHLLAGTHGYNHPSYNATGCWQPEGDRFAGAILLSEMLTWHHPEVRESADEASFFAVEEMGDSSHWKFKLMKDALQLRSNRLAELFDSAWRATTLEECPPLRDWMSVLATKCASRRG